MKPRRWIERMRLHMLSDLEHFWCLESMGLEAYLKHSVWLLSDYEAGQRVHPGTVYGKVRVPPCS